jgi:hypothetical protein
MEPKLSARLTEAHVLISNMRYGDYGGRPKDFTESEVSNLLERLDGLCDALEAEGR